MPFAIHRTKGERVRFVTARRQKANCSSTIGHRHRAPSLTLSFRSSDGGGRMEREMKSLSRSVCVSSKFLSLFRLPARTESIFLFAFSFLLLCLSSSMQTAISPPHAHRLSVRGHVHMTSSIRGGSLTQKQM